MNIIKYIGILLLVSLDVYAQETTVDKNRGLLSGNFETNTIYYKEDKESGALVPDDRIGSNNYLKLNYTKGGFTAGAQLEAYLPVLYGYPMEFKGTKLVNYYVGWSDEKYSILGGTFYEQFGSGLLFRSWEDRALGINNALMGARFTYNFKNYARLKLIWGTPRLGMEFTETQIRGGDLSISMGDVFGWEKGGLYFEGSVLNHYEKLPEDLQAEDESGSVMGYSGRIIIEKNGFSLKGEYVDRGEQLLNVPMEVNGEYLEWHKKRGNAQLVELGYSNSGLGISVTGRRLEWMNSPILLNDVSIGNLINYVPALCVQYSYMLATLHPYNPQTGLMTQNFLNSGEIGGQVDVYYNFKRKSFLGGKRGMRIHGNFSTYYTLKEEGSAKAEQLLFRDLSVDLEKYWSKSFKMNLLYSMQEYSPDYGMNKRTCVSNIFVADLLYKFTSRFSTRLELQYLYSKENEKDWMAGLLELNFAPKWSIYASDMYNSGSTKLHYYSVGTSYTGERMRIALNYGRVKDGYVCSGGVCRTTPAYTGANLTMTLFF